MDFLFIGFICKNISFPFSGEYEEQHLRGPWPCRQCSYENQELSDSCEICGGLSPLKLGNNH